MIIRGLIAPSQFALIAPSQFFPWVAGITIIG